MVRTREVVLRPVEPLVTARETYVAGLRCVGTRRLLPRETLLLQVVGYLGVGVGFFSALVLSELIRRATWVDLRSEPSIFGMLLAFAGLLLPLVYTMPALRTLRTGRVNIYRGEAFNLKTFDMDQRELFRNRAQIQEMVVLADGRTILQINGRYFPAVRKLRSPARVAFTGGPSTRALSEQERQELRDLIRYYGRPSLSVFLTPIVWPLGIFLILRRSDSLAEFAKPIFVLFAFIVAVYVLTNVLSWRRFSRRLQGDLQADVLQDGKLASGVPWLQRGAVAGWRLARPRVGNEHLNLEPLLDL